MQIAYLNVFAYSFFSSNNYKLVLINSLEIHVENKYSKNLSPFIIGSTPVARHKPPNLLLNILFSSRVAQALLVISTPAANPSKIRLRRSVG